MLDIIPSGGTSRFSRRRKRTQPSSHVLKVDWKLPARLRKPVHQQLLAERKRKRAKILGGFARRPLTTQRLVEDVPLPEEQVFGVERHTGDIYRDQEPQLRLVAPPYLGSAMKQALHSETGQPFKMPRFSVRAAAPVPVIEERVDEELKVKQPRRRLRLPFTINLLPKALLEEEGTSEEKVTPVLGKRLAWSAGQRRNIAILLIGCLLSSGVIWNLQGVGRAWGVMGRVEQQARQALGQIGGAQTALAENNFAASEAAFADAEALLGEAQKTLDESLATSRQVVEVLDVTGTVRSGGSLLVAGEKLSDAGKRVSRGLQQLLTASVLETEGEGSQAPTLVEGIAAAREELQGAVVQLEEAEKELSNVHSSLLPAEVKQTVAQLSQNIPHVRRLLTQFLDQSDLLLTVLGAEREREYLLLFANNHELRPVGGFLGSLGLVSIDRGVVEEIDVQTVYDGDGQLKEFIAPPDPLLPIVDRWYLRDSNWFVDFPVSARKAADFFEKEGGSTVDGVILLTPEVIRSLLRLTGPLAVPGYDVTVSADNFTEVVQKEVTYEYDRDLNRPKQFLADLTPLLLNRLLSDTGGQALGLLSALTSNLAQKDLLLFFRDEEVQKRVAEAGWAGSLPRDAEGFLAVNNANIGGHKSDQFIEQEIDYRLDVAADGAAEAVVTIRRTHHGPTEATAYDYPAGEDPATKDNIVYQRVLVPAGSQLLEAQGFTPASDIPRPENATFPLNLIADADVAEWQRGQVRHSSGTAVGREAGYTFFANWVVTKPGQTTVGLYRYRLPALTDIPGVWDKAARLSAYVFKQPGSDRGSVRVAVRLPEGVRILATAPASGVTQDSSREFVYRGGLTRDLALGAVFGRE